jgi:hypothetical protein
MNLSSDTHLTIRIALGATVLIVLCWMVATVESKPKEQVISVKVQLTPSPK